METSGGIRASLAGRYATALFDLARDQRQIDSVGNSLDALGQALLDSKEFAELVASPLVSRDDAGKAFAAIAPELNLDPITTSFVGVLARNGRKSQLRAVIRSYRRLASEHRGEATAEVVTARPLNDDPYVGGWLIRIRLSDPSELDSLLDAAAYRAHVAEL